MSPIITVAALLAVLVGIGAHDHPIHDLVSGQKVFLSKLYLSLAESRDNFVFSPAILQSLLGMLYLAADGNNAEQLAANIGLPHHVTDTPRAFKEMLRNIKNANEFASIALFNNIYYSDGFNISEEFRNVISKNFLGNFKEIDIQKESEAIKEELNAHLETMSPLKFKIINQPGLTDTNILAVSCLYFNGDWIESLSRRAVKQVPFHVDDNNAKNVDMLTGVATLRTGTLKSPKGTRVIQLPYKDNEFILTLLLPANNGLKELERQLKDIDIEHLRRDLDEKQVRITLPQFGQNSYISLKEPLIKLGLVDMFSEKESRFPGLTSEPLQISDVIQETNVVFSTNGTKFGTVVIPRAAESPLEFTLDQPFIYLIQEGNTKAIIAIGRYLGPE